MFLYPAIWLALIPTGLLIIKLHSKYCKALVAIIWIIYIQGFPFNYNIIKHILGESFTIRDLSSSLRISLINEDWLPIISKYGFIILAGIGSSAAAARYLLMLSDFMISYNSVWPDAKLVTDQSSVQSQFNY